MKILRMLAFAAVGALMPGGRASALSRRTPLDWSSVSLASIGGGKLPITDCKGRVVLLVNTASRCGFTGQYRGLEALWRRYKDRGLVVLGVPSNDFGGQEPGQAEEIERFCKASFDVTFPLADKQIVSGSAAHPLYRWAALQTGALGTPGWNFHKILIGRDGRIIDWFSPQWDRAQALPSHRGGARRREIEAAHRVALLSQHGLAGLTPAQSSPVCGKQ